MQKVFLARHGQTNWNQEMRFQGREDIPLNETGRNQARRLAGRLGRENLSAVFTSPLSRARETAEIIVAGHGLLPQPVEGLGEIYFGRLEGKTYSEMSVDEQNAVDQWMANPETSVLPGGETFKFFRKRILKSFQELLDRARPEQNFVVVSHAGVIKVLVADLLGIPFSHFTRLKLSPSSLTAFLYDDWGNAYLDLFNDTCHLANGQFA